MGRYPSTSYQIQFCRLVRGRRAGGDGFEFLARTLRHGHTHPSAVVAPVQDGFVETIIFIKKQTFHLLLLNTTNTVLYFFSKSPWVPENRLP